MPNHDQPAVTPLGEGGDEPLVRDSGSADAEVRNELRFFSEASAAALHALEDSLPPNDPVSLPPQRSDETRLMLPITCNGCDAKMGEYDALTEIGGIRYCEKCKAGARSDEPPTPNLGVTGSSVGVGARSGAGAEEALGRLREMAQGPKGGRSDYGRFLSNADAETILAEVTTLRAQLAEARKEIEDLRQRRDEGTR